MATQYLQSTEFVLKSFVTVEDDILRISSTSDSESAQIQRIFDLEKQFFEEWNSLIVLLTCPI